MKPVFHAKGVAVLGTGSDVGKSLITAGLCRLLRRAGMEVAPFKAQNMSLNSFVTPEGGEIGRAQALQAEACGVLPHVDMNPILLKPDSDRSSQVIVLGKVFGRQDAAVFFDDRRPLWSVVRASYGRLAARADVIVIEGAGSAAEVNLRDRDLVNWPVVQLADAQVLLVADIDRGGVFAQIVGTMDLLEPDERKRVRGVIINKFRGDPKLFEDGVKFLERRTGVPVLGIVPYLRDLVLDQEDSIDLNQFRKAKFAPDRVNIAVVLLPHVSNFTDFNALAAEEDVVLRYVSFSSDLDEADVVVIPGTKNTLSDLRYLREKGFENACRKHTARKKELIGICGGYQMLGKRITDPHHVEEGGSANGFAYLDTETELQKNKRTTLVRAALLGRPASEQLSVSGYQIHMGVTKLMTGTPRFRIHRTVEAMELVVRDDSADGENFDGAVDMDGLVWGTYIHGVFDQPGFRRFWLNSVRARKGLPRLETQVSETVTTRIQYELDRWANHLAAHLNMGALLADLKK